MLRSGNMLQKCYFDRFVLQNSTCLSQSAAPTVAMFDCVCATLERPLCACLVISICVSTAKEGSSVVWLAALRLPLILLKGKARQKSYDFSPSLTLAVREVMRRLQAHTREHILNYLIYHKNAQTHARMLAHWTAATTRVRETQLMAFLYLS